MLVTSEEIGGLHIGRYSSKTNRFDILSTFDDLIVIRKTGETYFDLGERKERI